STIFIMCQRQPPQSPLFPSTTLFRSWAFRTTTEVRVSTAPVTDGRIARRIMATGTVQPVTTVEVGAQVSGIIASLNADYNSVVQDRKSTRLNSSHVSNSYAGFCLNKK